MFRGHLAFLLFLVASISTSDCLSIFDDEKEIERGDTFIDDFLKDMMHDHGHEYDPYHLEEGYVSFSRKVAFVNISGEAKLHNGYITGLKSLHRADHCSLTEKGNQLYVAADLGAGVLNFHYEGTVKFMNFGPTIKINGELAYLETHMEFTVDKKSGRNGELTKFNIDDMKGMQISITGLGPLNWALNYLISGVTSLFKGYLSNMLEKKVRSHITERLPNYQFPVPGDDVTQSPEPLTEPEPQSQPEPEPEPELQSES